MTYPTLAEAAGTWARIAALSFGGPAGQIAVMHRILVEEKRWLGEDRFLHALNFCMLLPGPEAQQLATYVGWLMHGVRGALVAGLLFIAPGVMAIMALSWIYAALGDVPLVEGLFFGLKAAVLAIVVQAVIRVGKRALKTRAMKALAAASFVAIWALGLPFPVIVLSAALIGWALSGRSPHVQETAGQPALMPEGLETNTLLGTQDGPTARGALIAGGWALLAWAVPVVSLVLLVPDSVFADIAVFFSKIAVLSFGGAYAVLAWVAQEAVQGHGWLSPGEMLDGLGMAETTPGPLIMVLQYVGFLGALRDAGWAAPLLAGTVGGLLASWVTFAPCFAWIFLGAPWMERLRANVRLSAALSAVTAAVVGVILNLAIWFAVHVIWQQVVPFEAGPLRMDLPVLASIDWAAAALAGLSLLAVFCFDLGMVTVLGGAAVMGAVLRLAGLA